MVDAIQQPRIKVHSVPADDGGTVAFSSIRLQLGREDMGLGGEYRQGRRGWWREVRVSKLLVRGRTS